MKRTMDQLIEDIGEPDVLRERVAYIVHCYGGWRPAGRALGIDASYLLRLYSGDNKNPSNEVLDILELERTFRPKGINEK